MTINEVCDYENTGKTITAFGKFEGEPIFTPYFWNLGLEGMADRDEGNAYVFKITKQDKETIPTLAEWLGNKRTIYLREDSQGFVKCSLN